VNNLQVLKNLWYKDWAMKMKIQKKTKTSKVIKEVMTMMMKVIAMKI